MTASATTARPSLSTMNGASAPGGLGRSAADRARRALRRLESGVAELAEQSLRIGVTGLARSGKTVFIASLAANLLRPGRLGALGAVRSGRLDAAMLSPHPDLDVPRFDLESRLAALYAPEPQWPESTRAAAQLRVSLRVRSERFWPPRLGPKIVHLDLLDYPGEWLLDLGLMDISYADWAAAALRRVTARAEAAAEVGAETAHAAAAYLQWLQALDAAAALDEPTLARGAALYAAYLTASRRAGLFDLAPGRLLLPGDLAGAPVVTFAPLRPAEAAPSPNAAHAPSYWSAAAQRFEGYKERVAAPFFRAHFARIDRQVILVDALGAAASGGRAMADLQEALTATLAAFRTGARSPLARFLPPGLAPRRVERILVAATKADHIHHSAHGALTALTEDLVETSVARALFTGAVVVSQALAAVRATVEETARGAPCVRGRLLEDAAAGREGEVRLHPGAPPQTLAAALARTPSADAPALDVRSFAPPRLEARPGEGPPHLGLGRALEFLIGEDLA